MKAGHLFLVLLLAALSCHIHGLVVTPSSRRATSSIQRLASCNNDEKSLQDTSRRRLLDTAACSLFLCPQPGHAATVGFRRQEKDFGYLVNLPQYMSQPSNKPLKTHLDEINFSAGGANIGITVDPVRISSLREFGTPPEVAAKVVTAEVNRDGVFEVTMLKDPVELPDGSYLLEYLSQGKRGNKRNVCKIFIQNNKLYVLTAQAKEDIYDDQVEKIVLAIVDSFQII